MASHESTTTGNEAPMIQAAKLRDTEKLARFENGVGKHAEISEPGPGILGAMFSVILLAAFVSLLFHVAHVLDAQCNSASVLGLIRGCGSAVVVR